MQLAGQSQGKSPEAGGPHEPASATSTGEVLQDYEIRKASAAPRKDDGRTEVVLELRSKSGTAPLGITCSWNDSLKGQTQGSRHRMIVLPGSYEVQAEIEDNGHRKQTVRATLEVQEGRTIVLPGQVTVRSE